MEVILNVSIIEHAPLKDTFCNIFFPNVFLVQLVFSSVMSTYEEWGKIALTLI